MCRLGFKVQGLGLWCVVYLSYVWSICFAFLIRMYCFREDLPRVHRGDDVSSICRMSICLMSCRFVWSFVDLFDVLSICLKSWLFAICLVYFGLMSCLFDVCVCYDAFLERRLQTCSSPCHPFISRVYVIHSYLVYVFLCFMYVIWCIALGKTADLFISFISRVCHPFIQGGEDS